MQSKRRAFLASFLILFLVPSHSAEFEINFIEIFDENYMLEVIQELKYEKNIKRIKTLLDQKHWIERYEIKRNFFNSSSIKIYSRKPIFVWNKNSFVDKDLVIFPMNQDSISNNMLMINCPEPLLYEVFDWIKHPIDLAENKLISINYNSVEGWIFQFEDFEAKLGKSLDSYKFENLLKTIEYLYAKRKNASIVDLRSNAGISLKYDK
ncbi:hypothetical protein OAZ81_02205 [Pseudomonadota bacterium]|nr:hypothetical protein [Pseudomonadota bacterium]